MDDGSKDHSAKILREYEKKYPDKIHVIYQENQGQSAARNHALAMASGEFVAFVDSDDYIGKDFLKRMYNTAIEKKSEYGDVQLYQGDRTGRESFRRL